MSIGAVAAQALIERTEIVRDWLEAATRCECPTLDECPLFDDPARLPQKAWTSPPTAD